MCTVAMLKYNIVLMLFLCTVCCEDYGACTNPFRDMKNNKIDVKEYCNEKNCVVKCCKENELLSAKANNSYTCVNKSNLHVNVDYNNFTFYKGDDTKMMQMIENIEFIHNAKLDQKNCLVKNVLLEKFRVKNGSLISEDPNKLHGQIEMRDYCMDYAFNETEGRYQNVKFGFKLLQCMDSCVDVEKKLPINVEEYCNGTRCIAKCCRSKSRVFFQPLNGSLKCEEISKIKKITNSTLNIDFKSIDIYKSDVMSLGLIKSGKNLEDDFKIIMNKKFARSICSDNMLHYKDLYILENGSLVLDHPNYYNRFHGNSESMGEFCFDYYVNQTKNGDQNPIVVFKYTKPKGSGTNDDSAEVFKCITLSISSFCLLLVLFVYSVIRELRNLVGMVLMAFVGTLFVAFFIRVVELIGILTEKILDTHCKYLTVFLYYALLSSFFWMNVMTLDIWWTFRGMFKSRPIHRRGEMVKFAMYGLYAWGLPLLITIAVTTIDFMDLSHRPDIYKPHFENCMYISGYVMEMRHYLYMPILSLLVVDLIFFLMTSFNIWRIRRCMAQFANEASKYNKNQNRFGLYLKLSLVMGISWILEVLPIPSWLNYPAWTYDGLIGVSIFFIFVFKKKIFFKLCKRFKIHNHFIEEMERKYSRNTQQRKEDTTD